MPISQSIQECHRCGILSYFRFLYPLGDQLYCGVCADMLRMCIHSDTVAHVSEMLCDSEGNYLRQEYRDLYAICEECGAFVLREEAVEVNGEYFHPDHAPYRYGIHRYGYRPSPIFLFLPSETRAKLFMGVELEIEGGGDIDRKCNEIMLMAHPDPTPEPYIYGKHDSSVENGFELVTHPATLRYHMEKFPWDAILQKAVDLGYSRNPRTCGLHVHISRRYFGATETRQDLGIMKFVYLVEKFWDNMLVFSRRTPESLERWASRYGLKNTPRETLEHVKEVNENNRYKAVNLANCNTIEVRLFRGTLDPVILKATLQLCYSLAVAAKKLSIEGIVGLTWNDFVQRCTKHKELMQYLRSKSLA